MTPLRFVILAVLIFLAYRLLIGAFKQNQDGGKKQKTVKNDGPVNDVLVEDPVCHTLIPRKQAIHLQHQGSMFYFCSEKCCNSFIQQGEKE